MERPMIATKPIRKIDKWPSSNKRKNVQRALLLLRFQSNLLLQKAYGSAIRCEMGCVTRSNWKWNCLGKSRDESNVVDRVAVN